MKIEISEPRLRRAIRESLLLTENSLDRKVNDLIKDRLGIEDFGAIRQARADFLNKIPNARVKGGKWLVPVLQWYLDGQIPENEIKRLNMYLGWLGKNYNDIYYAHRELLGDDWTGKSFNDIRGVYDEIFPVAGQSRTAGATSNKVTNINGYTIRRIDSEREANLLGITVYDQEWCMLRDMFDDMIGDATCYIITNDATYGSKVMPMPRAEIIARLNTIGRDDVAGEVAEICPENEVWCVDALADEDCDDYFETASLENGLPPYDAHGLSAIVYIIYDTDTYAVYSKYNATNGYDGSFLTKSELSQLIGVDIDQVCPRVERPITNEQRTFRTNISEPRLRMTIREALDKYYGNSLKHYLANNDEKTRALELIEYNGNYFKLPRFFREHGWEDYVTEDQYNDILQWFEDDEAYNVSDSFWNGEYSDKLIEDFSEYLERHSDGYNPTSHVMDYTKTLPGDSWLVHFSDNAREIWINGFRYGTTNFEDLGYSGVGQTKGKESEGIAFAFSTDNPRNNYYSNYGSGRHPKYGSGAILFQANAVQATHYGDKEEQAMFYTNDARNLILIEETDNYLWAVIGNNGQELYGNDDIDKVIDWAIINFRQYAPAMLNPREYANKRQAMRKSSYGGV